jgi:hypothetical protein
MEGPYLLQSSWSWEYRGNNYVRGLGVGTTDGTAEASGKYGACLFKWGCINEDNIVITIHAKPGGSWSFDVRRPKAKTMRSFVQRHPGWTIFVALLLLLVLVFLGQSFQFIQ